MVRKITQCIGCVIAYTLISCTVKCTDHNIMSYGPGADLVLMKLIRIFLFYMQCVYMYIYTCTCNTKTTPLAVFVSEYQFWTV